MSAPVVSIIIPTYNRAHLIGETVGSLLNQRYRDFELVIIDDGSTDQTDEVIARFNDSRIKLYKQTNEGEIGATMRGWSLSSAPYAAIVSSDDPMSPFWLSEMVMALEADPKAVAVYPDWAIIDEFGETVQIMRTPDYSRTKMIRSFRASPGPGGLFRRSIAETIEPLRRAQYRSCSDLDMWLRLCLKGHFVRVPKVLANWRSHPGSITVSDLTNRRAQEYIDLAEEFFSNPDLPEELSGLKAETLANAHLMSAWVLEKARLNTTASND